MDDSLQPTIDMLLNLSIFIWFGAVCPWSSFLNNDIIPLYRLVFLGVLILLVRRMPIIFAMHRYIHQIEHIYHAGFVGFFGPIGVGAVFYLSISREFLREIKVNGEVREDAHRLSEAVNIIVWFLVVCSIVSYFLRYFLLWPSFLTSQVVHGLSIPLVKAGYNLPRTISNVLSTSTAVDSEPVTIASTPHTHSTATRNVDNGANNRGRKRGGGREDPQPTVFRIGRSVVQPSSSQQDGQMLGTGNVEEPERPVNLITTGPSTPKAPSVGLEQSI